jgi:8-oxo-dGTP pyrophosphatase MutT (NUDIX family)
MLALAAGQVALVRTYRYPVRAWQWGVPRGFSDGGGPAASARAELAEELGKEPAGIEEIGQITTNSGLLAGTMHLFAASYYPADRCQPGDLRRPADCPRPACPGGRIALSGLPPKIGWR